LPLSSSAAPPPGSSGSSEKPADSPSVGRFFSQKSLFSPVFPEKVLHFSFYYGIIPPLGRLFAEWTRCPLFLLGKFETLKFPEKGKEHEESD
jgi:hypothetical protein